MAKNSTERLAIRLARAVLTALLPVALVSCSTGDSAAPAPQQDASVPDNSRSSTEDEDESSTVEATLLTLRAFPAGWRQWGNPTSYFGLHCDWGGDLYRDFPPTESAAFTDGGHIIVAHHIATGHDARIVFESWLRRLENCDGQIDTFSMMSMQNANLRTSSRTTVTSVSVGLNSEDWFGFLISVQFVQKPLDGSERFATSRVLVAVSEFAPGSYTLLEVQGSSSIEFDLMTDTFAHLVRTLEDSR